MIHKAKKSLGQNFLKSKSALLTMCKSANVSKTDTILEIGPGKGALTEYLLKDAKKIIAIEKDYNLCSILSEKFANEITSGKLVLVQADILNFDPEIFDLREKGYKVVANIPYNITGAIFKKFLSENTQPESMTLLVQKEVAERIVARDNKESILSISVKVYGDPKYITKVSKKFFSPSPKIDSAIIHIANISKDNFTNKDNEDFFFEVLKAGFAHKRKVLKKNLEAISSKEKIDNAFQVLSIPINARAENVSIDKWKSLCDLLR